jgi:transposase
MRSNLFWLSDEQWSRIEPHLPTDVRGKERVDDRRIISGIVHVLKSGCRWKDCPVEYGPHTTVYNRFTRWAERGVWEGLFRAFAQRGESVRLTVCAGSMVVCDQRIVVGKRSAKKMTNWAYAARHSMAGFQ